MNALLRLSGGFRVAIISTVVCALGSPTLAQSENGAQDTVDDGPAFNTDLTIGFRQESFGGLAPNFGDGAEPGESIGLALLSDIEVFFFETGAGSIVLFNGRDLGGFGQTLQPTPGPGGFLSGGVMLRPVGHPVAYDLGLRFEALSLPPDRIDNNAGGGSLAVGGSQVALIVEPRIGVLGEFSPDLGWFAGMSGGLAFQNVNVTNGGVTVLSGNGLSPTVSVDAGVRLPLADGVAAHLGARMRWMGRIPGMTDTAVPTTFGGQLSTGLFASIRIALPSGSEGADFVIATVDRQGRPLGVSVR